jgi:hypothetical protein
MKTYKTREEAQEEVEELHNAPYYLSHGEYSRPHHKVRKTRGENSYYIKTETYFYQR